jgi:hypothetical protein
MFKNFGKDVAIISFVMAITSGFLSWASMLVGNALFTYNIFDIVKNTGQLISSLQAYSGRPLKVYYIYLTILLFCLAIAGAFTCILLWRTHYRYIWIFGICAIIAFVLWQSVIYGIATTQMAGSQGLSIEAGPGPWLFLFSGMIWASLYRYSLTMKA